jgi:hypothetical protein
LATTIVIVPRGDEDREDRPPACGVLRPRRPVRGGAGADVTVTDWSVATTDPPFTDGAPWA